MIGNVSGDFAKSFVRGDAAGIDVETFWTMRLPKLVIASFRRSCQSDIDDIAGFIAKHEHVNLTSEELEALEMLHTTLRLQWRRMEAEWIDHDLKVGNMGMEALAELGKIVEATGVAVGKALRISGQILGARQRALPPASMPFPDSQVQPSAYSLRDDTYVGHSQGHVARNGGDITMCPGGAAEVVSATMTETGGRETDVTGKIARVACDEATTIVEGAGVDTGDLTQILDQVTTQEIDNDTKADDSVLAGMVEAPSRMNRGEILGVEQGALFPLMIGALSRRNDGVFHEFRGSDVLTPIRHMKRPGDKRDPGAFLWTFWLQWCGHIWQRGQTLLPDREIDENTQQVGFFRSFWVFNVWQPGLVHCEQQHGVTSRRSQE